MDAAPWPLVLPFACCARRRASRISWAAESFNAIVGVEGSARHMCPHGPGCAECEAAAAAAQAMEAWRYQLSMQMDQGNGPPCRECGTLLIVEERQPDRGRCPRCRLEEVTWAAEGAAEFPALIAEYGHRELEHTPEHETAPCPRCDPEASYRGSTTWPL